jgi:26S proteasome regulatory subunit N12
MAPIAEVVALFETFKKEYNSPDDKLELCVQYLAKLKVAMLDFSSLPPAAPSAPTDKQQQELLLAREILEHGALLSLKTMDNSSFERHVAQLKVYYNDCKHLPESPRQYPILGLNLLRLLAQNRIAEFHTELELIPLEQQSSEYIQFPLRLEQHIMEGSYNKVLEARQTKGLYQQEGMYFMDMLVDTVREEIAECSEKAYASIATGELQSLLMLQSEGDLQEYAESRGWTLKDGTATFGVTDDKSTQLPATQLISETLSYAKELERIV